MSYCLNPYCRKPQNDASANFCINCGFKLLLGDRYRAQTAIGRGGFGRTFLAVDEYKPSRPKCVIKQFFPQHQDSQDSALARELFLREAIQLEQLGQHPQIPELLAHFEQAEYQYLIQEFIDGQNLVQEVTQVGSFNDVQVWHLLNNLLPVLQFLHDRQVIHRDIKPQNIIRRTADQQYVLVDFGAAKALENSDRAHTGTSIGSPEFTAPEQAIGKATFASDLYSLGVTCIYLLTQIRPADLFDTGEGKWVWQEHLKRPTTGVLNSILDKLLQGPINRRYQSATEALTDLHAPSILQALGLSETDCQQNSFASREEFTPEPSISERENALAATILPVTQRQHKTTPTWLCERTLTGHESWVRSVLIHPKGHLLASGSGDRTIKFWNLQTGELLHKIQAHDSWVRAMATSPNGQILASGSNDKTIKLWRWKTGELLRTLEGHSDWVRSVAFSADGQVLASSSQDKTIRLWDVATGNLLNTLEGHQHWVITVIFAPQNSEQPTHTPFIISGSRDKTIRLWNWQTGQQLMTLEGHTEAVNGLALAISPDGRTLASGSDDGTVRLWDLANNQWTKTLTGHEGAVNTVVISPDNSTLISGGQDKLLWLWDLQTGKPLGKLAGHHNWIWSIAINPTGDAIASGCWDGTMKIWRKQSGE